MSSYVFTENHNLQTVLWAVAGATYRTGRTVAKLPAMALAASLWAYTLLLTLWPVVALLAASATKVAAIALAIGCAVAVVAFLPIELFVGLGIVGVYALATMPKDARPSRCPYCKSTDVDAQRGFAECRDCGKTWSY